MTDPLLTRYVESTAWPSGSWRYAALWRDADGAARLTPVGADRHGRDSVPRWDGEVHPVTGGGAQPADRLPDGPWTLAVMSENPGELPGRRFTASGPERTGDPAELVQRLEDEHGQDPLRGVDNGLGRTQIAPEHRADGTEFRPLDARESRRGPDDWGRWQYAAFFTDDRGMLRYKPFGDQMSGRQALPRWAGDVRPAAPVPEGLDPNDAPKGQAWETDRPPDGKWVLGVVTQTPGSRPPRTFVVCGPAREDEPAAAVQQLQERIASSRSQAGGQAATRPAVEAGRDTTLGRWDT
jgi:hypothetical protein